MFALAYKVDGAEPLLNLALEEFLAVNWNRDYPLMLLYVNAPCIVIGRNQNPWREINPSCTLPWFRRTSGGGAVYHDLGNLNWSLVVPRKLHDKDEELATIVNALRGLGVEATAGVRGGMFLTRPDGSMAKISGTARRFTPRNVLHHGTLLISSDLAALAACLGGLTVYQDPSIPSVPATPVNLADVIPGLTVAQVADHLIQVVAGGMAERLSVPECIITQGLLKLYEERVQSGQVAESANIPAPDAHACLDGSLEALLQSIEEPEDAPQPPLINLEQYYQTVRTLASDTWRLGMTPPFEVVARPGKCSILVAVDHGVIARVEPLNHEEKAAVDTAHRLQHWKERPFSYTAVSAMEMEGVQ
ncbi:MAG: lipoate--protein ligase family protein [Rectinemataceae bacterium]